jgi:heme-degrading monooxygenase HmoA
MVQIMARVKIQELPVFVSVFSTRGAALRKKHGSRSAKLFRVADSEDEILIIFDWESREGFQSFLNDPAVKDAMKAAGTKSPPEFTFLEKVGEFPG